MAIAIKEYVYKSPLENAIEEMKQRELVSKEGNKPLGLVSLEDALDVLKSLDNEWDEVLGVIRMTEEEWDDDTV